MKSHVPDLRYSIAEEQQATAIHKALDKQDKVIDCEKLRIEVVERLRKDGKIYAN